MARCLSWGDTQSANFSFLETAPNRLQGFVGAPDPYYSDYVYPDAFLLRLDPTTLAPTYGTWLGGTRYDSATGMATHSDGTVFPESSTFSSLFALPVGTTYQFNQKTRQNLPWSTDIDWGTPPPPQP